MQFIAGFFVIGHIFLLLILSLFGVHRLSMVLRWIKYRKYAPKVVEQFTDLPLVTVQIPLFNEKFVAKRIIEACVCLNYPPEKLQIQIVDDSTDDTQQLVAQLIEKYRATGINIEHVQRQHRKGFKAGALKEAMDHATGEFIAIFDADFVPPVDILMNNIHFFFQENVGMVQFRWEHINRNISGLTKTQAIMLDAHFGLEQQVRAASGCLFNFNGTAGIWRTKAIIDSGHWSADTLTEDLDLSYRAQMQNWTMLYLNNVTCPGELPADMNAFKSQQHRWAKGGVQVLLKMLRKIWHQPFGLGKKIEATCHLANNLAYLVMLLDTIVFLLPSIFIREFYAVDYIYWLDLPLLFFASIGHLLYLYFSQVALNRSKTQALLLLPRLMLLGIQLAYNNAKAGFEALSGHKTEFVRTPKTGETENFEDKSNKTQKKYPAMVPKSAWIELVLTCVYSVVFVWAVTHHLWITLPFLFMLTCGFLTNAISNFRNQLALR